MRFYSWHLPQFARNSPAHPAPPTKRSAGPGVPRERFSSVSSFLYLGKCLLSVLRRNDSRQKYGQYAIIILAAKNLENDVRPWFELAHHGLVICHGIDRLSINFCDDVAAGEPEVVTKAGRIDVHYQHAFLTVHANAGSALGSQIFDSQAVFGGAVFILRIDLASGGVGENARAILDDRRGFFGLTVAHVSQFYFGSDRSLCDRVDQIVSSLDRLSVYVRDDIAALQAGFFRRAAGLNTHDHHAIGSAKFFQRNRIGAQIFLETDADRAARNAPLLNQLVVNVYCHARGKSKSDTFVTAAARNDCRIDADHFTGQIHQGPTGVSRVDGSVGLQELLKLPAYSTAIFRTDDSRSHGRVQAKRTANRQHPIADLHAIGIPQFCHRQFLGRVDLDHCQVRFFIHANDLRIVLGGFAIQLHLNLGGLVHNVVVGKNESLAINDHARTQAAFCSRGSILAAVKKAIEKVLHRIVRIVRLLIVRLLRTALGGGPSSFHNLRGGDIDDRRLHTIYDRRK